MKNYIFSIIILNSFLITSVINTQNYYVPLRRQQHDVPYTYPQYHQHHQHHQISQPYYSNLIKSDERYHYQKPLDRYNYQQPLYIHDRNHYKQHYNANERNCCGQHYLRLKEDKNEYAPQYHSRDKYQASKNYMPIHLPEYLLYTEKQQYQYKPLLKKENKLSQSDEMYDRYKVKYLYDQTPNFYQQYQKPITKKDNYIPSTSKPYQPLRYMYGEQKRPLVKPQSYKIPEKEIKPVEKIDDIKIVSSITSRKYLYVSYFEQYMTAQSNYWKRSMIYTDYFSIIFQITYTLGKSLTDFNYIISIEALDVIQTYIISMDHYISQSKLITKQNETTIVTYCEFQKQFYLQFKSQLLLLIQFSEKTCQSKGEFDNFLCSMNLEESLKSLYKKIQIDMIFKDSTVEKIVSTRNLFENKQKKSSYLDFIKIYLSQYSDEKKTILIKIIHSNRYYFYLLELIRHIYNSIQYYQEDVEIQKYIYIFIEKLNLFISTTEIKQKGMQHGYQYRQDSIIDFEESILNLIKIIEKKQIFFYTVWLFQLNRLRLEIQQTIKDHSFYEGYYVKQGELENIPDKQNYTEQIKSIKISYEKYQSSIIIQNFYNFLILCDQYKIYNLSYQIKTLWIRYIEIIINIFKYNITYELITEYYIYTIRFDILIEVQTVIKEIIEELKLKQDCECQKQLLLLEEQYNVIIIYIQKLKDNSQQGEFIHEQIQKNTQNIIINDDIKPQKKDINQTQKIIASIDKNFKQMSQNKEMKLFINQTVYIQYIWILIISFEQFNIREKSLICKEIDEILILIINIYKYYVIEKNVDQNMLILIKSSLIQINDKIKDEKFKNQISLSIDQIDITLNSDQHDEKNEKLEIDNISYENTESNQENSKDDINKHDYVISSEEDELEKDLNEILQKNNKLNEEIQFLETVKKNQNINIILDKDFGQQIKVQKVTYISHEDQNKKEFQSQNRRQKIQNIYLLEVYDCDKCLQDEYFKKQFELQ